MNQKLVKLGFFYGLEKSAQPGLAAKVFGTAGKGLNKLWMLYILDSITGGNIMRHAHKIPLLGKLYPDPSKIPEAEKIKMKEYEKLQSKALTRQENIAKMQADTIKRRAQLDYMADPERFQSFMSGKKPPSEFGQFMTSPISGLKKVPHIGKYLTPVNLIGTAGLAYLANKMLSKDDEEDERKRRRRK